MKKEIKNRSASIKAKLLNISKKDHIEFDALLLRYLQERFLYRLSISEFSKNFILKGGYLLVSFKLPWSRATKDIDFLAIDIKNTIDEIEKYFKNVAEIIVDDGTFFDSSSIYSERIIEDSENVGIRLKLNSSLGMQKKGFGNRFNLGDKLGTKFNRFYFNLPCFTFVSLIIVRVYGVFSKKTF